MESRLQSPADSVPFAHSDNGIHLPVTSNNHPFAQDQEQDSSPNEADQFFFSQEWTKDQRNPRNWSALRKWTIVWLLVVTDLIAAMCSSAFEPALPQLMVDFHSSSSALASFTISICCIGYCLGSLILAPISETYGRVWVLFPGYVIFMISLLACATVKRLALFIVFRALMGFDGIGFVNSGPAVIADLIPKEKRGLALSVMSTGPVVGPTLGPIIGGYIVERTTWRWIFWSTLIAIGCAFIVALCVFRETYSPILSIRADQEKSIHPARPKRSRIAYRLAWTRSLKLLSLTPIVPLLGIFTGITNSFAIICFATVGTVFQAQYQFTTGQSGLAFLGLTTGFIFCQLTLEKYSDRHVKKIEAKYGDRKPEYRLPPLFIGASILPIGLFWYGWSLQYNAHWIVPVVGTAFIAIGVLYTYLPVQMYLVDTYTIFAASATGACTIIRSLFQALVPLGANPLYHRLGYGWGNSIFGFISLMSVPVAVLLIKYGERFRENPRFRPKLKGYARRIALKLAS